MLSLKEISEILNISLSELNSILDKYKDCHVKDIPASDLSFFNHVYSDLSFVCNAYLIEFLKDRGLL